MWCVVRSWTHEFHFFFFVITLMVSDIRNREICRSSLVFHHQCVINSLDHCVVSAKGWRKIFFSFFQKWMHHFMISNEGLKTDWVFFRTTITGTIKCIRNRARIWGEVQTAQSRIGPPIRRMFKCTNNPLRCVRLGSASRNSFHSTSVMIRLPSNRLFQEKLLEFVSR